MTNGSYKIQKEFIVPEKYTKERLDHTLAQLMPEFSRTQIQTWIREEAVLLNQQVTKPNLKVKGGEQILVSAHHKIQAIWTPQAIPLNIVHEDEALLVINKPVGLVVHPGANNADLTLLNALLHHASQLNRLPRAGILHRLDKNTSGLLVVAKTADALKKLSHQLKKRTLLREYQALVYGTMVSGGTIEAPIGRHRSERKRMSVNENGKPAVTHYRIAEKYRAHTRLKLRLETGRTHQIRVHMFYIRHPIIGDTTYGGRVLLSKGMSLELIQLFRQFKHQALHAFALGFSHPVTNEFVRFEIDLPDDMKRLCAALREETENFKKE